MRYPFSLSLAPADESGLGSESFLFCARTTLLCTSDRSIAPATSILHCEAGMLYALWVLCSCRLRSK